MSRARIAALVAVPCLLAAWIPASSTANRVDRVGFLVAGVLVGLGLERLGASRRGGGARPTVSVAPVVAVPVAEPPTAGTAALLADLAARHDAARGPADGSSAPSLADGELVESSAAPGVGEPEVPAPVEAGGEAEAVAPVEAGGEAEAVAPVEAGDDVEAVSMIGVAGGPVAPPADDTPPLASSEERAPAARGSDRKGASRKRGGSATASAANGSRAKGSAAKGSAAMGSGAKGSAAKGSGAKGSGAKGSGAEAARTEGTGIEAADSSTGRPADAAPTVEEPPALDVTPALPGSTAEAAPQVAVSSAGDADLAASAPVPEAGPAEEPRPVRGDAATVEQLLAARLAARAPSLDNLFSIAATSAETPPSRPAAVTPAPAPVSPIDAPGRPAPTAVASPRPLPLDDGMPAASIVERLARRAMAVNAAGSWTAGLDDEPPAWAIAVSSDATRRATEDAVRESLGLTPITLEDGLGAARAD